MSDPSQAAADAAISPRQCAHDVFLDFVHYNSVFRSITQRAKTRFERREWVESRRDAVERIELYDRCVRRTVTRLEARLGADADDHAFWVELKACYTRFVRGYRDVEFTKTYFNSVTRRIFKTVGVDPAIEFVAADSPPLEELEEPLRCQTYSNVDSLPQLFTVLLADYPFEVTYRNITASGEYIAEKVRTFLRTSGLGKAQLVETIRPVFYRDTRAYLVGRVTGEHGTAPLAIALANTPKGIFVDAVVMDENEVSIIFGFARSYFHVDLESVTTAVLFLRSIMPHKSVTETFTILGRAKQGKTQRYREVVHHLEHSVDQFADAAIDKGMVMIVFTLPSYGVVFKVIRDHFAYPKTTVRADVLEKYRLVFTHDRVGRLVDAQEFRGLEFPRERFDPGLLEELLTAASETVQLVDEHTVAIGHLYVERCLVPLNQYVRTAAPEDAGRAVLDYGQAIRDLAAANVFPGDLLLKNFGVTRHQRVIFYDYDELCLVTECNFRVLPSPAFAEDEMRAGAWFYVGENDIFPEQFISFLGLEGRLREVFLEAHADLLSPQWWNDLKVRHERDEIIELVPYRRQDRRPRR